MSERFWRYIGTGLLILSLAMLGTAFLVSAEMPVTKEYSGRGTGAVPVKPLPHLPENDPVNSGSPEELAALPGVGPVTAETMLLEREENGLFVYPEDLTAVKGIGAKKLEMIRPELTVISGESEE